MLNNPYLKPVIDSNKRMRQRIDDNSSIIEQVLAMQPEVSTTPVGGVVDTTAPSTGGPVAYDGTRGGKIVATAKKYIGIPYVAGGRTPQSGMDCSAYTSYVLREALGIDIEALSGTQARDSRGKFITGLKNAQPGDILAFDLGSRDTWRGIDHVAIYLGNGKMIESPRPGKTIGITNVYATPKFIKRF